MESEISTSLIPKDEGIEELIQLLDREVLLADSNQLNHLVADILVGDVSKEDYFKLVYLSAKREKFARIAANAITILNAAKISFSDMNLSDIRIPGANLDNGIFHSTKFISAKIVDTTFYGAYLSQADFGGAKLINCRFGRMFKLFVNHLTAITSSSENNFILLGTARGEIFYMCERENAWQFDKLALAHKSEVTCFLLSKNPRFLFTAGKDGYLRKWQIVGDNLKLLNGLQFDNWIRSFAFINHETSILLGTDDGIIFLYDTESNRATKLCSLPPESRIIRVVSHPKDKYVAFCSNKNELIILQRNNDIYSMYKKKFLPEMGRIIEFSKDKEFLVLGGNNGLLCQFNYEDDSVDSLVNLNEKYFQNEITLNITSLCMHDDKFLFVAAKKNGYVVDLVNMRIMFSLSLRDKCIFSKFKILETRSEKKFCIVTWHKYTATVWDLGPVDRLAIFNEDGTALNAYGIEYYEIFPKAENIDQPMHTLELELESNYTVDIEYHAKCFTVLKKPKLNEGTQSSSFELLCIPLHGFQKTNSLVIHTKNKWCKVSPDTSFVVSYDNDETTSSLSIYDIQSQKQPRIEFSKRILDFVILENSNYILCGFDDGTLEGVEVRSFKCVNYYNFSKKLGRLGLKVINNNLLVNLNGRDVAFFEIEKSGQRIKSQREFLFPEELDDTSMSAFSYNPNNGILCFADTLKRYHIYSYQVSSNSFHRKYTGKLSSSVYDNVIILHPKEDLLIMGCVDGNVIIHNLVDDSITIFKAHGSAIAKIFYNLELDRLITIGLEISTIKFWRLGASLNKYPLLLDKIIGTDSVIVDKCNINGTEGLSTDTIKQFGKHGAISGINLEILSLPPPTSADLKSREEPHDPLTDIFKGVLTPEFALKRVLKKYNLSDNSSFNLVQGLIKAAWNDSVSDIEIFLRAGCNINERDRNPEYRRTALHWAISKGSKLAIKKLLETGARKDIPDVSGKTPLDYAKELGDRDIEKLFDTDDIQLHLDGGK
jgi:WD40 repeat protein